MTAPPKTYATASPWHLVPVVVALAATGLALGLLLVGSLLRDARELRGLGTFFVIGALALWISAGPYFYLPRRIVVRDRSVLFELFRRQVEVAAGSATSLRLASSSQGIFELRHRNGRVRFWSRFTGFHEVVLALKEQNPEITIEGC